MRLIAILAALAVSTAGAQAQSAQGTPMIVMPTGCSLPDGRTWLPRDGTCYLADAPINPGAVLEAAILAQVLFPKDRSWRLLTISNGGTVSLVKDLTKHECEFAMHRVQGEPATEEEVAAAQKRRENMWAEARDVCAHPEKYVHPAGPMPEICEDGRAVAIGSATTTVALGDIKSAECFQ